MFIVCLVNVPSDVDPHEMYSQSRAVAMVTSSGERDFSSPVFLTLGTNRP